MIRFCVECGKKAGRDDQVCIHCGNPLPKTDTEKKEQLKEKRKVEKRAPLPKKKKVLFSVIGAIAILIIGLTVWAQSYQSIEAVEKRFAKAVLEKDTGALKKLIVHSDGSSVTKGEAKALLNLVKEDGTSVAEDLFTVKPHGKFLLLFTERKAEAIDQFAIYQDPVKGLSFLFNDKEVAEKGADKDGIKYGPLVPGIYKVEAVFDGAYGKTKKAGKITLDDSFGDKTWLNMDVNVSEVVFYIDNYDEFDPKQAFIKLDDEQISIDKEGKTKSVGPFILDGSQQIQTVVTMPWGEVVSKPFVIDAAEMTIHADLLSEKQYSGLEEVLKNFGELYVESMAKKSTKPLKAVSADVKTVVEEMMREPYYSGKFEQVNIDRNSIQVDNSAKQPEIAILAQYLFNQAHHELDEEPDLYEDNPLLSMGLAYDKDKKTWNIISVEEADYWGEFAVTDTASGSKKLFGPGKEAIAQAKNAAVKEEITSFMNAYTRASVNAINYRDFYYVEDYIVPDSPRWKEAKEYLDYLESEGITESWIDSEMESVKATGDNTWEVTVIESFTIYKPDSSSDKRFRTKLVVKEVDDEYMVYELIKTDPL